MCEGTGHFATREVSDGCPAKVVLRRTLTVDCICPPGVSVFFMGPKIYSQPGRLDILWRGEP